MKNTSQVLIILFLALPSLVKSQHSLFENDSVLELTISGDIRTLLNDRGDDPSYHPISLHYTDAESNGIVLHLKAKTRGNFRRKKANCPDPPLLLNFKKTDEVSLSSMFAGQDEMKLVTPCVKDRYVVREYLVYKMYQLVTDKSFKAQLITLTYHDTVRSKTTEPVYAILLEDEEKMAARNHMQVVKTMGVKPERTAPESFHQMAVFEYLIGNTDWSVQYRHNVKLIASDSSSTPFTVPYDFDHSGIVSAPYARPSPALNLSSVRERRYRGYCQSTMIAFTPVFTTLNAEKDNLYSLFTDTQLLDDKYKKWVTNYLDKFYETINDPKKNEQAFKYPCDPNGTGNVIIGGFNSLKAKNK